MGNSVRIPALVLALALVAVALATFGRVVPYRPLCAGCNVVVVSLDTLRADHLGVYGYERPTSPRIDAWARDAVVFEDATAQSAWTRPSHASMFTGLYPEEHGILMLGPRRRMPAGAPTLASVFGANGYRTVAFTGGSNMSAHFGFDRGFDRYDDSGRRLEDHIEDFEAWLAEDPSRPFFAFLHGFDPHRPYKSLPEDRRALGLGKERARGMASACRAGGSPETLAPFIDEYDAAIHRGDRGFGRILDSLDRLGVAGRTVVLLTSDHGEEFLEHGRCWHIRTLYKEVVHVPLIVAAPGLGAGRVAGVVPASVSVGPTVLELAGLRGRPLPGPSLVGALRGKEPTPGFAVSETSSRFRGGRGAGKLSAITTSDDKLIEWVSHGRSEFFDRSRDPEEREPLPGDPRAGRLERRLRRYERLRRPVPGTSFLTELPESLAEELRALGYLR